MQPKKSVLLITHRKFLIFIIVLHFFVSAAHRVIADSLWETARLRVHLIVRIVLQHFLLVPNHQVVVDLRDAVRLGNKQVVEELPSVSAVEL